MQKKKLLVFHAAIAPYRIDLFNELNSAFDANFYFFRKNLLNQKFDIQNINSQLNFNPNFLTSGFDYARNGRMIRFSYLNKIISNKPDIILCWEYNLITILTTIFTKLFFRKTSIYSICDDSIDIAKNSSFPRNLARIICLKYLDGIILCNESAEEWYNKKFPKVKTNVFPIIQKEERVINIINSSKHFSELYLKQNGLENKTILLFVGRIVAVKNLMFLIDAFSKYIENNKNAVLILVGDGDKKNEFSELILKRQIQNNIILAGRFENEALYGWYLLADYFILPSIHEPFGAVVNEALISGLHVICSKNAGAACLINTRNGEVFNPFNKDELLAIFHKYLSSKKIQPSKLTLDDSLMPYSFKEKFDNLLTFLC